MSAPKRPAPALKACMEVTLMPASASLHINSAMTPGRSVPVARNALCFLPRVMPAFLAAAPTPGVFLFQHENDFGVPGRFPIAQEAHEIHARVFESRQNPSAFSGLVRDDCHVILDD
jgi:hypothetical protein